jgi:hypothetical protein
LFGIFLLYWICRLLMQIGDLLPHIAH